MTRALAAAFTPANAGIPAQDRTAVLARLDAARLLLQEAGLIIQRSEPDIAKRNSAHQQAQLLLRNCNALITAMHSQPQHTHDTGRVRLGAGMREF